MQIIKENNKCYNDYEITSYETDAFYEARLNYYFGLVQEVAGKHAAEKGLSIMKLQEQGLTWVISRTRMNIEHYGKWLDKVNVVTWAQKCQLFHCPRKVVATDENGNPVFTAKTMWAIINMGNGRPIRPENMMENVIGLPPEDEREDERLPKMPLFEDMVKSEVLTYKPQIQYLDTDYNHHVNNISYINWINEALPVSFRDKFKMSFIDCRYLKQTFRNDNLLVSLGSEEENALLSEAPKLYFKIERINGEERERVFDAYTEWKVRSAF